MGQALWDFSPKEFPTLIFFLFSQDIRDNAVISPLSIIGAMYMLAAGTGGISQEEILNALDYREVKDNLLPFHAYKQLMDGVENDSPDSYTLKLGKLRKFEIFL